MHDIENSARHAAPAFEDAPLQGESGLAYWLERARRELEPFTHLIPATSSPRGLSRRRTAATGLALATGVVCLGGLARVAARPTPSRFDIATTRLLQRRPSRTLTRAMVLISTPGFAPLQHVLTFGMMLDLWAFGRRREAFFTMMTMGAGATTGIIKIAVGRPRPEPAYVRATFQFRDNSFPSGHCTHYASFYGYMFYLARRAMPPSALRTAIMATCTSLIALVAPSRVYLGHHWTSDVLAGEIVGLTYLFTLVKVYENVFTAEPASQPC